MNKNSLTMVFQISRSIFVLFLILVIFGAITKISLLVYFGMILASISWITPGILIVLNFPWFAQFWLRGINSFWFSGDPWDQLTGWKKFTIYFFSILFSSTAIIAIASYIIH